eukprot:TRINITY_DN3441_c0_g1_i1.p1 TRINITY_DN3441_c0_g1~~TRINITY_DN3441_c0_g1_i1.p1  ORF type:complete len:135 (-),score=16.99 TRINITY_DN3441_c0_g1_i1:158-562(-)
MAWTDYTNSLQAYGCGKSALIGLDGSVWATTPDGCLGADEAVAIAGMFGGDDKTLMEKAFGGGFKVGGDKFMAVNGTGSQVESGNLTLLGKQGPNSCAAVKSVQCIVLGVAETDPAAALGHVNVHVTQLAGAGY